MRNLIILCLLGLFIAGCSKSEESSKSEQLGQGFAEQMKAPIEKARTASEKASATREVEIPK
ncbi:MAG: hypothetical protein ISR85_00325 [Kiritimatiellales bacterium]|nr:hypothetical protein [Kiritimatiellota bacterium]MBL7011358.1 hypothetical protein [Kiritimatiellales bacterium]